MPRGDGTGPNGQGNRTGRGMGFCAGLDTPGFLNSGFGRGRNLGRGRRYVGPMSIQQVQPTVITEKQEKQFLEQELNTLKEEMKEIEKRLNEKKD